MNPIISIIVPVYKVEKYLPECFDSLQKQTYDNLEIVLVDDGSPDNCGIMCDEFAKKNSNAFVIHQNNQGLSAARNNGVQVCKGEYIFFVDSDDFISSNCIEYLYGLIKKYDADVSVSKSKYYWDCMEISHSEYNEDSVCFTASDALKEMCYGKKFALAAWNKLYKRDLVLQFPYPVGKVYEEVATTYKIIGASKKVAFASGITYFYRMRDDSIVHEKLNAKQLYGITASEEMLSYISMNYPEAKKAAEFRCFVKICDFVSKSFGDKKTFSMLKKKAMKYTKSVLSDKNVSIAMKLRCCALCMGYIPSRIIFPIVDYLKIKKQKNTI